MHSLLLRDDNPAMILGTADNTNSGWHLLGAGAIGGLFATELALAGTPVRLLLRDEKTLADYAEAGGLQLFRDQQPVTGGALPLPAGIASDADAIHRLLITTKSYDARPALAAVQSRLAQGAAVLLLVNGMGVAEQLQAQLAQRPDVGLYCACTTEGAFRRERFCIEHAGRGHTLIGKFGSAGDGIPDWLADLQCASLKVNWCEEIQAQLWRKLAINCAINPLTALHNCRNGELAGNPGYRRQVTELCREIAAVGAAAGFDCDYGTLVATVGEVIDATAGNISSMLQDTRAGRRTEIDDITGYLCRLARKLGLETPHNAALLQQLETTS